MLFYAELAILVRINAKMHYFEPESLKIFRGCAPSPGPNPIGERDAPSPSLTPSAPRPIFANPQLFFHNSHTVLVKIIFYMVKVYMCYWKILKDITLSGARTAYKLPNELRLKNFPIPICNLLSVGELWINDVLHARFVTYRYYFQAGSNQSTWISKWNDKTRIRTVDGLYMLAIT